MLLTKKDFSGPLKFGLSGFHCIIISPNHLSLSHTQFSKFIFVIMHVRQLCFIGVKDHVVVKVDGLLIVLLGDALIDAMETRKVVWIYVGGDKAIHVVSEAQVVARVRVTNHGT
jgi:hypothetical protein